MQVISLTVRIPEAPVRFAALGVGCIAEKVYGGFILRAIETGEILDGCYEMDAEGYVYNTLWPWSAEDVLKYCADMKEVLKSGMCAC